MLCILGNIETSDFAFSKALIKVYYYSFTKALALQALYKDSSTIVAEYCPD